MHTMSKHVFGAGVRCAACGEIKTAVFASNHHEAAVGRGTCEECLKKAKAKPIVLKKSKPPVGESASEILPGKGKPVST